MKFLNLLWLLCLCSTAFNSLAQSTQPAAHSTSQSTEGYYATGWNEIKLHLTSHGDTIVLFTGGRAAYHDRFFDAGTGRYLFTRHPTNFNIAGTEYPGFFLYDSKGEDDPSLKTVVMRKNNDYGMDIYQRTAKGRAGKCIIKKAMLPVWISPNQRFIITKYGGVLDAEAGRLVVKERGERIRIVRYYDKITLSSDGLQAGFAQNDKGKILIMDLATGDLVRTLRAPSSIKFDSLDISGTADKFELIALPDMKSFVVATSRTNFTPKGRAWLCRPDMEPLALSSPDTDPEFKAISDSYDSYTNWTDKPSTPTTETKTIKAYGAKDEDKHEPVSMYIKCSDCNGSGVIMQKNIAYNKTTTTYSSGAGSGSVNYRVTSTPVYNNYAQRTNCSRCNGAGNIRKR